MQSRAVWLIFPNMQPAWLWTYQSKHDLGIAKFLDTYLHVYAYVKQYAVSSRERIAALLSKTDKHRHEVRE